MKISAVDVYVLKTTLEQPFAFSQGWVTQRAATLVRVSTDNGLAGWGEAFTQGLEPPEIAAAAIEHAFIPLLLGENPLDHNVIWHRLYASSRDYGRKGSVVSAISALDTALWDISGQYLSQPIHRLLGGAHRQSVTPYATGFYRLSGRGEADRLAAEALGHRDAGFTAMKIKLGFGVDDDLEVMHAIRDALGPSADGLDLMIDTNHAYGRSEALRLGRALDSFNLRWYEEPLAPEDTDGYRELRQQLSMPIAGGENEHTPYGFRTLFEASALDIAQPDIGSCGGLTAARDITAMAQAAGVVVNPHVWGSAIAQAASLQWIASLPVTHHSVFPQQPVLEYDRSTHPFRQALIKHPWSVHDGLIKIPTGPGLGIDVQLDVVEQYSGKPCR